jgi:AraC-like DNA-binding protein
MIYIESGVCSMLAGGRHYSLQQGQCILIPPHTEHSYSNETPETVDYLEIKFTAASSIPLRISDSALAGSLFRQVVQEYPLLGRLADKPAAVYMSALLCAITEQDRLQEANCFQYVDASAFGELARSVIRYLEAHYQQDLRLDDIAAAMDHNKSYLCVAFKKDTGFTILDCLNTIRVRRAAELIVYSDHGFPQVADMCGFTSVTHFNRVFLKYVGITPGQCRRAYPADILFGTGDGSAAHSNRFMYSVLSHKTITPNMIRELGLSESKK